jgi:hypothetical protein
VKGKPFKKPVIFRPGAAGAAAVAPAEGRAARGLLPEAAGVALSHLLLPPDRAGAWRARHLLQRGGAQPGIQQVRLRGLSVRNNQCYPLADCSAA